MKIYNSYVLSLSSVLLLTTVILAALGGAQLSHFLPIFILEAIIVTELFVYFNSKARRQLTFVSIILCGGFLVYLALEITSFLTRV